MTHVHSDHVVDLADVVMTRWISPEVSPAVPLPLIAPEGSTARFVRRMLETYDDIALQVEHVQPEPPVLDLRAFEPSSEPTAVWTSDDGAVTVDAVAVHHEPVLGAVGYRVTTPAGVVVISGGTRVYDEIDAPRG